MYNIFGFVYGLINDKVFLDLGRFKCERRRRKLLRKRVVYTIMKSRARIITELGPEMSKTSPTTTAAATSATEQLFCPTRVFATLSFRRLCVGNTVGRRVSRVVDHCTCPVCRANSISRHWSNKRHTQLSRGANTRRVNVCHVADAKCNCIRGTLPVSRPCTDLGLLTETGGRDIAWCGDKTYLE